MIEHCPTEEMLGDHFTKPLQGALFRKFRAEIMNIPYDLDMGEMGMDGKGLKKGITCKLHNDTDPGIPQECVGDFGIAGRKMVLWSSQILGHVKLHTMPLNWRKEIGHGR